MFYQEHFNAIFWPLFIISAWLYLIVIIAIMCIIYCYYFTIILGIILVGVSILASKILTVPQAAEKLQMNTAIIREYLRVGKLPGRKVGRAWRVLESDLELWISTGQNNHKNQFVSARGLLKKYSGTLTSDDINASKRLEGELEEAKFPKHTHKTRKSA